MSVNSKGAELIKVNEISLLFHPREPFPSLSIIIIIIDCQFEVDLISDHFKLVFYVSSIERD